MKSTMIIWAFIVTALLGAGYIVTSSSPSAPLRVSKDFLQKNVPAISKRSNDTIDSKRNVESVVEVVADNVKTRAIVK